MWNSILVFTVLYAVTLAVPVKEDENKNVDNKAFLLKQKDLLRLFKDVLQPNYYTDQAQIAKNYQLEDNLQRATSNEAATKFLKLHRKGLLPRGDVFSIFIDKHRRQAVALFDVMYFARDWDTFYKLACWAREYVNEGMFVYVMHVAVQHRHDIQGLVLPPIYEINPYFFVNGRVIDRAYRYILNSANEKQNIFYVDANYTDSNTTAHGEQNKLAHIYNDVRFNAKYFYFHITYPFWMKSDKYGLPKGIRGELFYYFHQQILARYTLERLANGYGPVGVYSWQWPIVTGYNSTLRYPNGVPFPPRPAGAHLIFDPPRYASVLSAGENLFRIQQIEDYESRLRIAIDFGYILTSDVKRMSIYTDIGFNSLGNLAECNADSENTQYFGPLLPLARHVLGYANPPVNSSTVVAGALEHYETSIRDPMFFQFFNRIVRYMSKYKDHLHEYNQTELECTDVVITDVSVTKLRTFWEKFEFEVTNAVHHSRDEDIQVWARQHRLNHKPFNYKITVKSAKPTDVVVRAFIGPKYDESGNEIDLNENRLNFVEFDKFVYSLQAGKNVIERDSSQTKSANDPSSFRSLYQSVLAALKGEAEFRPTVSGNRQGFVLPKGSSEGRLYKFFVFISPQSTNGGANVSFGYPLDRQISDEESFLVPNSYLFDEKIYHIEN